MFYNQTFTNFTRFLYKVELRLFSIVNIYRLVRSSDLKIGHKMQTGINVQKMQKKRKLKILELLPFTKSRQSTSGYYY